MGFTGLVPGAFPVEAAALAVVAVLAVIAGIRLFASRPRRCHRRGALVLARGPRRLLGPTCADSTRTLSVAGVPLSLLDETKHFKMIGTTGTGKSTAIRELMSGALGRGDRAIFADPDGGYRREFSRRLRGEVVLNPFEAESQAWDPLSEIDEPSDVDHLSSGLIPSSADTSANEWRSYARTFLSAVLLRSRFSRHCTCAELWRLLAVASVGELRDVVADTPAQPFLDEENARMFGSIRAVAVSAMAALPYIGAQRSRPFSVRRWVSGPSSQNVLFLPYKANQIAALRSVIATWMRIAIFEAMNGRENGDQRLWFVVDELDALGAIEGLKDALARLRKFGGRCVLGFQSLSQVSGTYGASDAQTIVENCGNTLILRCSGSENGGTSQFASRLIGEREVLRRQVSRGRDRESSLSARGRRSTTVSEQPVTEPAVMPSQIEQLSDLHGYLKTASSPAWLQVRLGKPSRKGTSGD
jgi:type IV secretory pathway TraG/TraD family ATPase VirD4